MRCLGPVVFCLLLAGCAAPSGATARPVATAAASADVASPPPARPLAVTAAATSRARPAPVSTVPPSTPTASVPPPEAVARAYLETLQYGQWHQAWQLLSPAARARWSDEAAFAAFLAARFAPAGKPAVTAVHLGKPMSLAAWNDVRFTDHPLAAVEIPAVLQLAADAPYAPAPSSAGDEAPVVLVPSADGWSVADGGPADVQGPVLVPAHPVLRRLRVPIMMYHHIAPEPSRTPAMGDYDYRLALDLTVTPDRFAAQLDWLAGHGYSTVTLPLLMAALYDGVALPAHPIVLTFDDGYRDNAQYAAPALLQRHMVGTFNVVTGLVGSTHGTLQYMDWAQLGTLAAEGMPIESHTVFHRDLGVLSPLDAQTELVDSRQMIAQHLGLPPQFICYPSGEPFRSGSAAAQQRILRFVAQDGYVGGLLDPRIAGAIQSSAAPYQFVRIRVAGQETLPQFVASIENQPGP